MVVDLKVNIETIDSDSISSGLHENGYVMVPKFLSKNQCDEFIHLYDSPHIYRKTVVMERHRFGLGEYKYFDYPLPESLQCLRENLYPLLASVANLWMSVLKMDRCYPNHYQDFLKECHSNNQLKPTPLILKYGEGGFNTLHQDLYGDIYFPIQAVLFLSEPGKDFTGGEFVLTQQIPRAQSKAIVLAPKKGDMLFFTTNFRPVKGAKGYYRVNMKHGVSEVKSGHRHTMGIIFHDATS